MRPRAAAQRSLGRPRRPACLREGQSPFHVLLQVPRHEKAPRAAGAVISAIGFCCWVEGGMAKATVDQTSIRGLGTARTRVVAGSLSLNTGVDRSGPRQRRFTEGQQSDVRRTFLIAMSVDLVLPTAYVGLVDHGREAIVLRRRPPTQSKLRTSAAAVCFSRHRRSRPLFPVGFWEAQFRRLDRCASVPAEAKDAPIFFNPL